MDYYEAEKRLRHAGHGNEMPRRKLQNNTYLERLGRDCIGLLLHNTYIAEFRADRSVVLDSGGWRTATTKDRLSWVGGWRVFSGRHVSRAETHWWLAPIDYRTWADGKDGWVPFFDGIHVHQRTGEVLSADEELEREMEYRDPGPSKREKIAEYLTLFTEPEKMARVAAVKTNVEDPIRENHMAYAMLENQFVDLSVIYKALRLDAAKRGELDRSPERETMEWLDMLQEGREPPRVRSIIRNFITYLEHAQ